MVRGWKFWILKEEELYYPCILVAKTKALISFAATAKLICALVFAYADCLFSHAVAQIQMFYMIMCVKSLYEHEKRVLKRKKKYNVI